jgi:hypothetical protein
MSKERTEGNKAWDEKARYEVRLGAGLVRIISLFFALPADVGFWAASVVVVIVTGGISRGVNDVDVK